ncbi:MAG: hypothetical protein M1817_006841 [Caeruleum heppii]|nr:MAG: hypothetical protein M1817_006841 [Caeruleum heppii]
MSLPVALQSVLYYFVACSPCRERAYRRKRKQEALQSKQLNSRIETEEPGLYRHPSPFSTNIYWREEMLLGPGPPPKRATKNNDKSSQRRLTGGTGGTGGGSSLGSSAGTSTGDKAEMHIAPDARLSGDGWNRKRYQREDELLWGHEILHSVGHNHRRRGSKSSALGLVGISRAGTLTSDDYYTARNPPVNELHPPVVSSQPTHKSETRWMLQPPPSAKIMNGKERANRSRSDSGDSSRKGDVRLERQLSQKVMDEKIRRGERPRDRESLVALSRAGSKRQPPLSWTMDSSSAGLSSPPSHDENKTLRSSLSNASSSRSSHRKSRPSPISTADAPFKPRNIAAIGSESPPANEEDIFYSPPSRTEPHDSRDVSPGTALFELGAEPNAEATVGSAAPPSPLAAR